MFCRSRKTNEQALFLKNLDLLAYEDPSSFPPDSLPTLSVAEQQLRSQLVRSPTGGQHSLLCDLEEFKQYGPGLYLLFQLVKFISLLLAVLSPLMLVNIILITNSGEPVNETNFETIMESTTISELDNPAVSRMLHSLVVLFIALGLGYWRWKMPVMIDSCRREVSLPSYCTVVMKPIPNFFTEKWLKEFAETHYGPVHSIYTAKNYHQDLHHYKQLRSAAEAVKQEREFYLKNKGTQSSQSLCDHFFHLRKLYHSLSEKIDDQKIYQPYCVFLTFQHPSSKKKALQSYSSSWNCLPCFREPTLSQIQSEKPCFKSCKMEPDGVAWQNLNLSKTEKMLRCGLVFLVLFLFLFVAITIIFILVAAESGLFVDEYDNLTFQQILMTHSDEALKSYCMELSYTNFKATRECRPFLSNYKVYFMMFFMLPVVVTLFKMLFISIMKRLVAVRRHKDGFQKMEWQIVIISLFYFIKAALIPLLIYRKFNVFGLSFDLLHMYLPLLAALKSILRIKADLIHSYPSFSSEWVAHSSHNVIIIAIISFNFTILYHFLVALFKTLYHKRKASSMRTQQRMNKQLLGHQFQIEMIYSQLGALFLFLGVYLSCMPIVYPLVLFSMGILYWGAKYTFIRLCRRPLIYAHGVTSITVNILFIALVLSCLLTPQYFSDRLQETAEQHWVQNVIDKWQNLALLITIVVIYFLGNPMISMSIALYSRITSKSEEESKYNSAREVPSKPNRIQSYSMHQNEQYKDILQTLFIVNKIEINRIGYFNHHTLHQLKEEANKSPQVFHLFQELLAALTEECQALREQNRLRGSKQENSLALLMQIGRKAQEELEGLKQEQEMKSLVKSKIASVLAENQNITKLSAKRQKMSSSTRRSRDIQYEPEPETQIRIY